MTPEPDIRPLDAADVDALDGFFRRIPEGDRTFFREDVLAPGTIERWLADTRSRRYVAVDGPDVVGYAAVLPGVGWSTHVAELRIVVDPARRRGGIGRGLARRGVVDAVGDGITKLVVEVFAEQDTTVTMFSALGFEVEGLLKDHVRSQSGDLSDLLVLAHFVDRMWETMETTGLPDALGGPAGAR